MPSLKFKDVASLLYVIFVFLAGDLAIAFVSWLTKGVVNRITSAPNYERVLLEWLIAAVVVTAGGYLLAIPVWRAYRRPAAENPPATRYDKDRRLHWFSALLRRGGAAGYIAGSLAVGAPGIAWWNGRQGAAHQQRQMLGAAVLVGLFWSGVWIGAFSAQYRLQSLIALAVVLLAVAALHTLSARPRTLRLWNVLGYLYDGLFALKPHRELVASAALRVTPGLCVLNAGCGTGMLEVFAKDNHDIVSVDSSPSMLARARRRVADAKLADITQLPCADGLFDLVICLNVLYALAADQQVAALREMARVLRPGGRLVLASPVSRDLFPLLAEHWRTAAPRDHLRFLVNLPRLLAWMLILAARGWLQGSEFTFRTEAELIAMVTAANLTIVSVEPCYAGIDRLIEAAKNSEGL